MSTQTKDARIRFLCICDVLVADKESVTSSELLEWSTFVINEPVCPLYREGRKLFALYRGESMTDAIRVQVLTSLDIESIRAYCTNVEPRECLLGLGEIFATLGKHSNTLLARQSHGELINQYVNLFTTATV